MNLRDLGLVALALLGVLQMAGNTLGSQALTGLGAASAASPAPKVFSAVRGFETYSARFFVEWNEADGSLQSHPLTPERTAGLEGPYNRRNVYGAGLAYAPVLPAELRDPVMRHGLCGDAPLLAELGLERGAGAGKVRLRLEPRPGTAPAGLRLLFEAPCQ